MYRPKPVFQSQHVPSFRYISIVDAREAYDVCRKIHDKNSRMMVYEAFGLDGEAVEKYLPLVEDLSNAMDKTEQYERFLRSKYFKIGPFHIYISI
jgi:hypothetical protein